MPYRILCDEGLRVSLDGAGGNTHLTVSDDRLAVTFQTATVAIEAVLAGETIQLSSPEGFCRIQPEEEAIFLEFGLAGKARKTCRFHHARLAEVVSIIRARD